jgi:hypothetical protein
MAVHGKKSLQVRYSTKLCSGTGLRKCSKGMDRYPPCRFCFDFVFEHRLGSSDEAARAARFWTSDLCQSKN